MAVQLNLTTPETFANTASYQLVMLTLDRLTPKITIRIQSNVSGRFKDFTYEGSAALSKIIALNKANLSTAGNSLEQQTLGFLISDFGLAGTFSGSPD